MTKLPVLLSIFCLSIINMNAQDAVRKVTKNFFRSDPFASEFATFLNHIINDPSISEKEFVQRSDTGLFYFHGIYNTHNPFFFKPKKVEVVLAEVATKYSDSLDYIDTILIYQLIAYAEPSIDGMKDVKKEFEKIHKQIAKGFSSNNHNEQRGEAGVTAGWYNYFVPSHGIAPVTLMWGMTKNKDEAAINITVRMKTSYNRAILPAALLPPYN